MNGGGEGERGILHMLIKLARPYRARGAGAKPVICVLLAFLTLTSQSNGIEDTINYALKEGSARGPKARFARATNYFESGS